MNNNFIYPLFGCFAFVACSAYADTLQVTVSGIKPGQGSLRVAVFDEVHRDQFAEGKYLYGVEVPAKAEKMAVEIPDLVSGEYAVAVIQDINGNGKLDRNMLKIPKEPYGFSGSWKWGGASYEEASFHTDEEKFLVSIKLK
ncbi:MAG: DUF2141 domain-containing protein [Halioglobus sp.]